MLNILVVAMSVFAVPQAAGPSFDCARATTEVERVICADPALGLLDRRMAARFSVLRQELDGPTRRALLDDQRDYLWARNERFKAAPASYRMDYLRMNMLSRSEFLDSVSTVPRAGLTGLWADFMGEVFVSVRPDGKINIRAQATEPMTGRWTCDFDVNARIIGATARGVAADTPDAEIGDGWAISLERAGAFLVLEECCQAGHCGSGGTISGRYLPLNGGLTRSMRDYPGS